MKNRWCWKQKVHSSDLPVIPTDGPYSDVEEAIDRASQPLMTFLSTRDKKFKRILHALTAMSVLLLFSSGLILSAVQPGVPLLRIYEKNQRRTGQVVTQIVSGTGAEVECRIANPGKYPPTVLCIKGGR